MWFKKSTPDKQTVAAAPVETGIAIAEPEDVPMPSRGPVRKPIMSTEEAEEYCAVAAAIGIADAPALLNEKVRQAFRSLGVEVYNSEQVVAYLDSKLGKGKWGWCGLRKEDVEHLGNGWSAPMGEPEIPYLSRQYGLAVPLPVLLTVKQIMEKLPEVHFYVSAEREPSDEDPFLMVSHRNMGCYIVERWDEPGFREK